MVGCIGTWNESQRASIDAIPLGWAKIMAQVTLGASADNLDALVEGIRVWTDVNHVRCIQWPAKGEPSRRSGSGGKIFRAKERQPSNGGNKDSFRNVRLPRRPSKVIPVAGEFGVGWICLAMQQDISGKLIGERPGFGKDRFFGKWRQIVANR